MLSRRVIAAGLLGLGAPAMVCFAAVADHLRRGSGIVRAGAPPACGCAPFRAGRTAPPFAIQPSRQPAGVARSLPQGQSSQQHIAEPSAKVDLPGQAVASATAVIRRNSPRGQETAQRRQSDGAKLVDPGRPASAFEPAPKPAIVPVASADAASDLAAFESLTEVNTTRTNETVFGPDGSSATLDGRTVGRAVASTVVGYLSEGVRPSRLLGQEGRGSLLATSLDGIWAIGEQAALGLIVEGKLPGPRALERQAVQVLAAAAQQEVAGLAADAAQFGQDNGIRFLRNLEVTAGWAPGDRPGIEARSIDHIFQSVALDHTVFLQGEVRTDFDDTTVNLGIGYRYLLPESDSVMPICRAGLTS